MRHKTIAKCHVNNYKGFWATYERVHIEICYNEDGSLLTKIKKDTDSHRLWIMAHRTKLYDLEVVIVGIDNLIKISKVDTETEALLAQQNELGKLIINMRRKENETTNNR